MINDAGALGLKNRGPGFRGLGVSCCKVKAWNVLESLQFKHFAPKSPKPEAPKQ